MTYLVAGLVIYTLGCTITGFWLVAKMQEYIIKRIDGDLPAPEK